MLISRFHFPVIKFNCISNSHDKYSIHILVKIVNLKNKAHYQKYIQIAIMIFVGKSGGDDSDVKLLITGNLKKKVLQLFYIFHQSVIFSIFFKDNNSKLVQGVH